MTVEDNETDSLFWARQTFLWLDIEKEKTEITIYTTQKGLNLIWLPFCHCFIETSLISVVLHSDAVQCFSPWIPISTRYLASANGKWLSHWPRFNSNADTKGLIPIYIKETLHCCQCEQEWGPKEKQRGSQKWLAGMISFYRGCISGTSEKYQMLCIQFYSCDF